MSDFEAKMHPNRFRLGHCPRPAGDLTALPRLPSWNKEDLLLREGERCRNGKERRRGRQRREGKGAEGTPVCIFDFSLEQPMTRW